MNAQEARELFSAALENDLDADQRLAFEAALADDPTLAAEYAAFVATVTRVRSEGELPAAPDLLPRVQRRLRARSAGGSTPIGTRSVSVRGSSNRCCSRSRC